jgi:excisionase family DNA binding protein
MKNHKGRGRKEDEVRPEFYTVSQVAQLLQLTEMTIYRMVAREELPCYRIGRLKRFRHSDIEAFLEQCRMPSVRKRDRSTRQTSTGVSR